MQHLVIAIALGVGLTGCASPMPERASSAMEGLDREAIAESSTQGQVLPVSARARLGGETIDLEVTSTPQQQALGLMYRRELPDNRGMLFGFDPPRPVSFWMKNVPIPLDMIFVRDGKITAIESEVPPCQSQVCPTYGPLTPVDRVIELRGGRAAELGLQVGDRIEIEFFSEMTPSP